VPRDRRAPGDAGGLLLRRIAASAFARHVGLLVSGAALGHGLTALAAPILGRLYTPAEFGLLALFTALVAILAEAASWRYELAIVLPADDEDARTLVALASLVVIAMALASLAAVALAGDALAGVLESPALAIYLWWLPPALLVIGLYRVLSYWATRKQAYRRLSAAQIARSLTAATVQLATGLLGFQAGGLIGGRVAGETGALAALGGAFCRRGGRPPLPRPMRIDSLRRLAREYADFPKFSLPQGLVNAVSQSMPAFLLAYFFDAHIVGLYAMAHRLLHLPARFIGQAVRQVFLQQASERLQQAGDLRRLHLQTTLALAGFGFFPALIVLLWGPELFTLFLGDAWQAAGGYARWMVLWLFFAFINPPSTVLMQVLRRQHILLIFDLALFACRTGLLVYAGLRMSAETAIAAFSLAGAIFNAGLVVGMLLYGRRAGLSAPVDPQAT